MNDFKKYLLIGVLLLSATVVKAQIFETAGKPKKGELSLGVNPFVTGDDWGLFLRGSYGLGQGFDARFSYAFIDDRKDYINADFGKNIISGSINVAARAGFQIRDGRFGLNCTGLADVDILKSSHLYSGIMMEVNFPKHADSEISLWVPIGLEWNCNKTIAFLVEADLGADDATHNIFSAGLKITF